MIEYKGVKYKDFYDFVEKVVRPIQQSKPKWDHTGWHPKPKMDRSDTARLNREIR